MARTEPLPKRNRVQVEQRKQEALRRLAQRKREKAAREAARKKAARKNLANREQRAFRRKYFSPEAMILRDLEEEFGDSVDKAVAAAYEQGCKAGKKLAKRMKK